MQNNNAIIILLAVAVLVLAGIVYNQTERPQTPGEQISQGLNDAAHGVGQAVEDAGHNIKRSNP